MAEREVYAAIVLDDDAFSVHDMAVACAVNVEWVVQRVEEGALFCPGATPDEWRFGSHAVARARRIRAVERDFGAEPELAALVADMLDEIDALRGRLRRAGLV